MIRKFFFKNFYRTILTLFTLGVIVWACDNSELDMKVKLLFEPELKLVDETAVDNATPLEIKISSKVYKEGLLTHNFAFYSDKKGVIINPFGDTIQQGQTTDIVYDNEFQKFKFIGKEIGEHNLRFEFQNSKAVRVEQKRSILVKYASFDFTAEAGNIGSINIPKKIIIKLKAGDDTPKGTTYKIKAVKENLLGVLKNEKGEEMQDGVAIDIKTGEYEYTFTPSSVTDNGLIKFEVEDNYGQRKPALVELKISEFGFDFSLTPSSKTNFLNDSTPIAMKITPIDRSTTSKYKMKFTSSMKGSLGGNLPSDNYFDVSDGNFTLDYIGFEAGEHTVIVDVKDEYGGTISKEFKITIERQDFDFTASAVNLSPVIGTYNPINFLIKDNSRQPQKYQMKYQVLQGGGELVGSAPIAQNVFFDVEKGDFVYNFKTTAGGVTKIRFTAVNSDGTEKVVEVELKTIIPEFTFTASAISTTQSINEDGKISYILQRIGEYHQAFEIKFESNGDGTLNGHPKNRWFDINEGSDELVYIPKSIGQHQVVLTVRSKTYGTTNMQTINITAEAHKFNFTVTNNKQTWTLHEAEELIFNIEPNGNDNGQSYELSYSVKTGEGQLEGISQNVFVPIQKGNTKINFTPSVEGKIVLEFIVRNTDKTTEKQTVEINVETPDFDFKTVAQAREGSIQNPIPVSYTLSPKTNNQTFKMMFETTGDGKINGHSEGVWFDVEAGNKTFEFVPTSLGEHNVTVYVENQYGRKKESKFQMTAKNQTFGFEATSPSSGTATLPVEQTFTITPDGNDNGQSYQLRFTVEGGTGKLNGVNAGEWINVNKGTFKFDYVPTSAGVHKLTYTAKNTAGTEQSKEVHITVTQPDFAFTGSADTQNVTINQPININFNIDAIGNDLNTRYEMSFVSTKRGSLDGKPQNSWFTVQKGGFSLPFVNGELGTNEVTVKVRNQYGVEKEAKVTFNVVNYDFTISTHTENLNPYLYQNTTIGLLLEANGYDEGQSYSMYYQLLEGSAEIEGFTIGQPKSISKGTTDLVMKPNADGKLKIKFVVTNTARVVKESTMEFNVGVPDFAFRTTPQAREASVLNPINVAYTLTPYTQEQTFKMMFETTGDGKINGHSEGVWFDVEAGNKTFEFVPTSLGQHDVTVYVENQYGTRKESKFQMTAKNQTFGFEATSPSSGTATLPVEQTFTITPDGNDNGQSYQLRFTVEGGTGKLNGVNAGEWINVNKGTFKFDYVPTSAGVHKLTYTAKNTAGTEQSKEVHITVTQPDFAFTGSADTQNVTINQPININFNIDAIGNDLNTRYEMSFVSTKRGSLDGKPQNSWFTVQKGGFSLPFVNGELGTNEVTVKVRNQYGVEKEAKVTFNVVNYDFTISTHTNNMTPYIQQETPISLILEANGYDDGQNYALHYELIEGNAELVGYAVGQAKSISKSTTELILKPLVDGKVKVKFVVTNSARVVRESTMEFNVKMPKFNFSASPQTYEESVNNSLPIYFNIETESGSPQQELQMWFETTGTGKLADKTARRWFNIYEQIESLDYIPAEIGTHKLTFKVKNQYGYESEPVQFDINVVSQKFDFTANSTSSSGNITRPLQQNFEILPRGNDTGISYEMMYEVKEGSGYIENFPAGTFLGVKKGAYNYSYVPQTEGTHTIVYSVRNSANPRHTETKEVRIVAIQPDFDFTAIARRKDVTVTEEIPVRVDITPRGDDINSKYYMRFSSDKEATLNGRFANEWFEVQKGSFDLNFINKEIGQNKVKIEVRNAFQKVHTAEIDFNTTNFDFSFDAISTVLNPNINDVVPVVITINPIRTDAGQSYELEYRMISGQAKVEGYSVGIPKAVNKGRFNVNVTPIVTGDVVLEFIARNTAGTEHRKRVSFNSSNPKFNFTAVPTVNSVLTGQMFDVNCNLSPIGNDDGQIYKLKYVITEGEGEVEGFVVNIPKEIGKGSFNIPMKFTKSGNNTITFVASNTAGEEVSQTFSLNTTKTSIEILTHFVNEIETSPNNSKELIVEISKNPKLSDNVKYKTWISSISNGGTSNGLQTTKNQWVDGTLNSSNNIIIPLGDYKTFVSGDYILSIQAQDEFGSVSEIKEIPIRIASSIEKSDESIGTIDIHGRQEKKNFWGEGGNGWCLRGRNIRFDLKLKNNSRIPITSVDYKIEFRLNGSSYTYNRNYQFNSATPTFIHKLDWSPRADYPTNHNTNFDNGLITVTVTQSNGAKHIFTYKLDMKFVRHGGESWCSDFNP